MKKTIWKSGDYNAVCDRCGFKFKASDLQETWDGLKVCKKDWEMRHPLDFPVAQKGPAPLPWTRPEVTDVFVAACTVVGRQAVPGLAQPDCAIPNLDLGYR
jgi:hypothetical protein